MSNRWQILIEGKYKDVDLKYVVNLFLYKESQPKFLIKHINSNWEI